MAIYNIILLSNILIHANSSHDVVTIQILLIVE
jgi:hypothetical protein